MPYYILVLKHDHVLRAEIERNSLRMEAVAVHCVYLYNIISRYGDLDHIMCSALDIKDMTQFLELGSAISSILYGEVILPTTSNTTS